VAQAEGPEFKPQYHKKRKKKGVEKLGGGAVVAPCLACMKPPRVLWAEKGMDDSTVVYQSQMSNIKQRETVTSFYFLISIGVY
jgi:hypothetical protein